MAYAVNFTGANLILKAPQGRDDVQDLHVFRNRAGVVSCWQLGPEELEEVQRTGKIYLEILGPTMAPAFIGTESVMRAFTADYGILPEQPTKDQSQ